MLTKVLGLPLVLAGVAVLVVHFLLRRSVSGGIGGVAGGVGGLSGAGGNVLLCVGIALEVVGIVGYCWRIRHPQKDKKMG